MKFQVTMILIFILACSHIAIAQESIMINFEVIENEVHIEYILNADKSATYNIRLQLRRRSDDNFKYTPQSLQGDIGEGKFAGEKRKIIWKMDEGEKKQLIYDDFYFEIFADIEVIKKSWPWYYYASGIGVVGIAVALLWPPDEGGGGGGTTDDNGFPTPPPPPITK